MRNTIEKGDQILIKDNLMEELVKTGFNADEMVGFVNRFKGSQQTAYDVYELEPNKWFVTGDLCCEIPMSSCEKIVS